VLFYARQKTWKIYTYCRPLNVLRTTRGGIGGDDDDVVGASETYIYYINIGLPYKTNVNPLNRLGPRILCVRRVNQYNIQYTRHYIHTYIYIYRERIVNMCVCLRMCVHTAEGGPHRQTRLHYRHRRLHLVYI